MHQIMAPDVIAAALEKRNITIGGLTTDQAQALETIGFRKTIHEEEKDRKYKESFTITFTNDDKYKAFVEFLFACAIEKEKETMKHLAAQVKQARQTAEKAFTGLDLRSQFKRAGTALAGTFVQALEEGQQRDEASETGLRRG